MIFLTLISCFHNGHKSASQNDKPEPVPEPGKELSEISDPDQKELSSTGAIDEEFLGEKLRPIRKKLRPIATRQEWTSIDKRKIETEKGIGAAEYYFLQGQLQKIILIQKTTTANRFVEFYINNDSLFFVFEKQIDSIQLKNNPEYYDSEIDSLFFDSGELIRIKTNMDCGAPCEESFQNEEQIRLQTEFENLLSRLKQ